MPNPDEAREEAWREWRDAQLGLDKYQINAGVLALTKHAYTASWDARGRYDEQRVADLESKLERMRRAYLKMMGLNGEEVERALGQSEEVKP